MAFEVLVGGNKGQVLQQSWANFSSMICGKYPTNSFCPNTFIEKIQDSPEWTQYENPWGVKPPN
jgi:hypothetical protein